VTGAIVVVAVVAIIRRMPGRMTPFRFEKQAQYPSQDSAMGFRGPFVIITPVVVSCVVALA
jgi:hypothetical protein